MATAAERKERRLSGMSRPSRLSTSFPRVATFETVDELDDDHMGAEGVQRTVQSPSPAPSVTGTGTINPAYEADDPLEELDRAHKRASQVSASQRRVSKLPRHSVTVLSPNDEQGTVDELDDLDHTYRRYSLSNANRPSLHNDLLGLPAEKVDLPKTKESYFKKPCTRTNLVLLGLTLLFFITTEGMISAYLYKVYEEPPPKPCLSEACLNKGKLIRQSVNPHANPCTNFYDFACGNFQRQEFHGSLRRDLDDLMTEELLHRMRRILESINQNVSRADRFEARAGQLFQMCLDSDPQVIVESTKKVLENITWNDNTEHAQSGPNNGELLKSVQLLGIPALFRLSKIRYPTLGGKSLWFFREGLLPLPDHLYQNTAVMSKYVDFVKDFVTLMKGPASEVLNRSAIESSRFLAAVIDLESKLAAADHEPDYFQVAVEDFVEAYPSLSKLLDFPRLLEELENSVNGNSTRLTRHDVIILKNRGYFKALDDALRNSNTEHLNIYLAWRIAYSYIDVLQDHPTFRDIIRNFLDVIGAPIQSKPVRCVRSAIEALPDGGVAMFSKRYLGGNKAEKARSLFDRLTKAAKEIVSKQEWILEPERSVAAEKFDNVTYHIPLEGYFSDQLSTALHHEAQLEYDSFFVSLNNFRIAKQKHIIRGLHDLGVHFDNVLSFKFGADYRLDSVGKSVISVFPKAFISPMYNPTFPDFDQYASLGFLFARELVHAVDYQWFQLNKTSTHAAAPSKETLHAYHMRLGVMLNLYRNVSWTLGYDWDSETLYEDAADQAAMRLAFRAYQKVIQAAHDALLPGLTYEDFGFEQMFFLSFAQNFCENPSSTVIKNLSPIGFSHPRVRLTSVVQNSNEFNMAFKCGREFSTGAQLFDIPDPTRKIKYNKEVTAKQIEEWYHWFERKPGLPTWSKAW